MLKRGMLFWVIVICAVILGGCSYSQTGIDTLLTPPKLSDQQNQIYSALEAVVGKNVKLKYPRRGDFTSAFIINNIDGEPTQEAIVFYENTTNSSLRMNVLDQQEGRWFSAYEISVDASEVDKVSFVISNQEIYIIVGYNLLTKTEKSVSLYGFREGIVNEISNISCSDYEVYNMTGDQTAEIVAFVPSKGDRELKTVTAMLYKITPTGTGLMAQTPMDPDVSGYAAVHKGKLADGRPALYIDGLKGTNSLCTQIIAMNDLGRMHNLMYGPEERENLIDETRRGYGSLSMDLNGDGIYEIPNLIPSLGYERVAPPQKQHFTEWYNYVELNSDDIISSSSTSRKGELVLQKTTYVSYALGYIFTVPPSWLDKIKIDFVMGDSELVFYDNSLGDAYDAKLMSIKVLKRTDYEADNMKSEYSLLKDNGQLLYTYKLYESSSDLLVWPSDVKNGFALLQI